MDGTLKTVLLGGATRQIKISFPNNDHAAITSGIVAGSEKLESILNKTGELDFGECNSSQFIVEIEGLDNIAGKRIQVYETVEGYSSDVLLFNGIVYSAIQQPEASSRVITAYDDLYFKADLDLTSWFEGVFPGSGTITVKSFRDALFAEIGITQVTQTLMNDTIAIQGIHVTEGTVLTAGDLIRMVCQMNACFGHIMPNGTFKYISLGAETATYTGNYQASATRYGEYAVQPIDRIRVYGALGNVLAEVGSGTNIWSIANNWLIYGVQENDIYTVISALYSFVNALTMKSVELEALLSLPEDLGSRLTFVTHTGATVNSYILENRLYGSQMASQTITANIDERRRNDLGQEDKLEILNARMDSTESTASNAMTIANGKNKIYYQTTTPTGDLSVGDLWMDTDNGNSLYEYRSNGWVLHQLGQGSIAAGSITANELNVNSLSAISANIGSITDGSIGAWTIGSTGIYNGLTSFSGTTNGTYIGTDGIVGAAENGLVRYELTPDGHLYLKDNKGNGSFNVGISLYANVGSSFGEYRLHIQPHSINGYYIDANNVSRNPLEIAFYEGSLTFDTRADRGILKNTYNNTIYNLIRNHNNGDISISASSGGLYLGYENTTSVDFFNGKILINSNGLALFTANMYCRRNDANAWIQAENTQGGNAISIEAHTDGTVVLWSRTANGTPYDLIKRANNSSDITTNGNWYFNGNIAATVSSGEASVRARNSTTGNSILLWANASNGRCGIWSQSANGTAYSILERANNSNAITASGNWTFNNGVYGSSGATAGSPVITTTSNTNKVNLLKSASTEFGISAQWGASSYSERWISVPSSDIRLKENITDSTVTALPLINSIRMREFDWTDGRHQTIGFIADELEELDSKLAIGGGYTENGDMSVKSVDTFYLVGYLVKAVQELSAKVKALEGAS